MKIQNPARLLLRLTGAAAGAAITFSLLLGLAVSASMRQAYSPLLAAERHLMSVIEAAAVIPLTVGLLGLIGPKRPWVARAGAGLVYFLSPLVLAFLLLSNLVPPRSEEAFWMALYVAAAGGYWFFLTRRRRPPLRTEAPVANG